MKSLEGTLEIAGVTIDIQERADYTIDTCKLNRKPLCLNRWRVVEQSFIYQCKSALEKYREDNNGLIARINDYIEEAKSYAEDVKREHTLVWRYIMNSKEAFNEMIVSQFENDNQRDIINAVYDTFNN